MERAGLLDFVMDLIRQVETACEETDPGMQQAAGMVYVGDVYALLVTRDGESGLVRETVATRESVWPFIR